MSDNQPSDNEEKRIHARRERQSEAHFTLSFLDAGGDQKKITCHTLDVSKGGFRVGMNEELPVGFISEFCLESEKGQMMLLYAELRWCRKTDLGFECGFQILDAENSDLSHWMAQN